MKVFVLGHRGMLGHMVASYLAREGFEVVTSTERYQGAPRDNLVEAVRASNCDWVVNALGRIKQKSADPAELYLGNAIFPLHLRARLNPGQHIIHASSDCVFSGRDGQYAADAQCDAEDHYGLSKALGEAVAEAGRHWVIRTSIIGPEKGSGKGLMAWFLAQQGEVKGFTNHWWNGITTLEWARLCAEIIHGATRHSGPLLQAGSWPPVTKCELLEMISKEWNHAVKIRAVEASERIDRSLKPTLLRKPLEQQLADLRDFEDELA